MRLTRPLAAAGLAAALAALPGASQAAHVLMSLQAQTDAVFRYHLDVAGNHYEDFQWALSSRNFPVTVAQGDTVNSTVRFDAPVTVGPSTLATDFYEFASGADWLEARPAPSAEIRGALNFYLGTDLAASFSYDSTSPEGLGAFARAWAPGAAGFTFDNFINAFAIVSLDSPQTLDVAQFTYTNIDRISAAPEPAAWAMLIGGFAIAGAALRRTAKRGFRGRRLTGADSWTPEP